MSKDFLRELGYVGFVTRLKRISDAMLHEGRRLYSELDVDIEPNWYVIFKLLKSEGPMSVMDIADSVQMAHSSIITLTNKMLDKGYLISEKDQFDSRKRVLDLSDRAIKMLPKYEEVWNSGAEGIEKALNGIDGLEFISILEDIFFEKGFKERTLTQLKQNGHVSNETT